MTTAHSPTDDSGPSAALVERLVAVLGQEQVALDPSSLATAAQDVYRAGVTPAVVISPSSTQQVADATALVTAAGASIYVRGAGMSYTDAVTPACAGAVVLKTDRLAAIREINVDDLYVTVETGCTWLALDETLAKSGVRALFHGPMSGRVSTVGGAIAQGAVTFGSGRYGASGNAVIGVEVVTADGSIVQTGSAAQSKHNAFFRDYGPDLTGIFCGDAGALGIKTAVTLRLQPRPAEGASLTFAIADFDALLRVVKKISREGYATELFGAEAALVNAVAGPPDLRRDLGQLWTMVRAAKNPLAGLGTAIRVATAGRRFLSQSGFFANFLVEGRDTQELRWHQQQIRLAVASDGVEVANTMAEYVRSLPFPEPAVLGPEGRRLLPLHGVVPFSRAAPLHKAFTAYVDKLRAECEQHDVQIYIVFTTSGSAGFMYECVIYWKDEWLDLHRQTMSDATLAAFEESAPNPQARALVERIRLEVMELLYSHGCVHYQVGRAYPYSRDRNVASLEMLRTIKAQVDPDDRINPGALGLAQ